MNIEAYADAQRLWDYMKLDQPVVSADLLLVLGSIDDRVALYAAELSRTYGYGLVVFSGGIAHGGDLLSTAWDKSEAEHFFDTFMRSGGKARQILLETAAVNTGQNALLTYELLQTSAVKDPQSIEIVTKPYMERRAVATFEAQWPNDRVKLFATSPRISFAEYVSSRQQFEITVNIMVGDFERIVEYPKHGFQAEQDIPVDVLDAWRRLVGLGYTSHMISK